MRIAFINPDKEHDYNANTPWERGLGGSESAQVYLSIEMAKRGHDVYLFTGTKKSGKFHGVNCENIDKGILEINALEAIIVTNCSTLSCLIRKHSSYPVVVSWEHNTWNTQPLENPLALLNGSRDIILCVSHWQREHFIESGNLNPDTVKVLRNAPSPWFNTNNNFRFSYQYRHEFPSIIYISVPSKGLEQALVSFLLLHKRIPQAEFHIYSDYSIYSPSNFLYHSKWAESLSPLLKCRQIVSHGAVSQKVLCDALKKSWLLLYPCIIQETSSIVVMEAMAAGVAVVTTPLGALPETCSGYGFFPEPDENGNVTLQSFASLSAELCQRLAHNDKALTKHLYRQALHFQKEFNWALRAQEFETMLYSIRKSAT
ncbi:Glycosyl transferases group 1 [Desulfonatronum zhilinae]|nr:Glycosyl transferases group 1 [Desulfonatronum zhilinae]